MKLNGWLGTLSDETRERVFSSMRSIDLESNRYLNNAARLRAPAGSIPIGAAGFDEMIRYEILASYLRAIRKGSSPSEAENAAKLEARDIVESHNKQRSDVTWKRWSATAESTLEYQHGKMIDAVMNRS